MVTMDVSPTIFETLMHLAQKQLMCTNDHDECLLLATNEQATCAYLCSCSEIQLAALRKNRVHSASGVVHTAHYRYCTLCAI